MTRPIGGPPGCAYLAHLVRALTMGEAQLDRLPAVDGLRRLAGERDPERPAR